MQQHNHDWKKYVITFFLTATLFGSAFYVSNYLNNKRIDQIKTIEDKISLDILSSETQYDLLQEVSCQNIDATVLSPEINTLADKLTYTESVRGATDPEFLYLKKYYSLLQIKDYLLSKRVAEKCGTKTVFIIYLYTDADKCDTCQAQGQVLTEIRKKYPDLRVYSFDYNLDLSAIHSLLSLYRVKNELPVIIINGQTEYGFKTIDEVESLLPKSIKASVAAKTATPTVIKK